MDFKLGEDQILLKSMVRDFAEKVIQPLVREHDEEEKYPPQSVIKQASEIGLVSLTMPEEYGGTDLDYVSAAIVVEELSRVCVGFADAITARTFGFGIIHKYGTEEQKKKYLPPLATGESAVASALTEPDAGSDLASIKTKAVEKDGSYMINGEKTFITNGGIADFMIVATKTSPEKKHRGITLFIVDSNQQGVESRPLKNKLGVRASDTASITFDDVIVPKDMVLGEIDRGFYQLMEFLDTERMYIAAQSVGIAQGAFEAALKYSKDRVQFGNPIFNFQAIQFKLADMATEIESARLLTYKAAALLDEKEGSKVAEDISEMALASSMAKLYASHVAVKCASEAIQIHGGYGLMKDYPVEKFYRDAKVMEIYEGTSEIQRLVIAKQLSKMML